jgi:LysM repeat protein
VSKARLLRVWAIIVSAVLALSGVVGITATLTPAKAISGSSFDPGLIIGDSVFYDFGATDAASLQAFMDQQVPRCKSSLPTNPAPGEFTCLRYYRTDIPAMPASAGRCNAIDAANNQTVAQMLIIIGRACNINPRVLLVTLQKEQGLVTSTNPFWPDSSGNPSTTKPQDYRYQIAMGFACPDTGPCTTFGFFYQVYKAAGQFHWYGNPAGSFTYLKVGSNVNISYQANKPSCGKRTFLLKSQATAALYYYTPYTPNEAALKNLYGSGDSCSAYGNRNFWRYYWDWFGSPIGGGFLLQSATSDVYLITPDPATGAYVKHRVSDASLATALAPLGPIGRISQDYLDSFPTSTDMNRLVKSATNNYFFVDGGRKYVLSSCDQAATYGLNCATAVQLSAYQLNAMPSSGTLSSLVPEVVKQASGPTYLISGGQIREILDAVSVASAGITLPAVAPVPITAFNYLPWGPPIAKSGQLFKNRTNGNMAVTMGGKYYEIDPKTSDDMDFKQWFIESSGTLRADSARAIDSGVKIQSIVKNSAGLRFVLTPLGRRAVAGDTALMAQPNSLPDPVLAQIPLLPNDLKLPFLAKAPAGKNTFYISEQTRRYVPNAAASVKLSAIAAVPEVQELPASALQLITAGSTIFGPGTALTDPAGRLLLTDGISSYKVVATPAIGAELGIAKPAKATKADLLDYTSGGGLGYRVQCGAQQYLALNGKLQPIADAYATAFPGKLAVLDETTCANLKRGTTQLGRFVLSPAKLIYLMSAGKRRLVTKAQYEAIRGTTPVAFKIDDTLAALWPIGTPMPASYSTVLVNPNDLPAPTSSPTALATASPAPTVSATPKPSASATATASPKPSVTVTPSASPKPTVTATASPKPTATVTASPKPSASPSAGTKTYKVVAGDTLTKIAAKFGTTIAAIKALNGLTSDVAQLGRVLLIP